MNRSNHIGTFAFTILAATMLKSPAVARQQATDDARKLVEERTEKLRPFEIATGLAWWKANISGKDEDFRAKEEAENRLNEALADPLAFRKLKQAKERGTDDPVVARAIEVLYLAALEK